MNPKRSHRPISAHSVSLLSHLVSHETAISTSPGIFCVHLQSCWPELLGDCEGLGAVLLASHNGVARFAVVPGDLDFAFLPGSTEFTELGTGFLADTAHWSHALAVEESTPEGSRFSLQFIGPAGLGLWKIMLTREARLEYFADLVRHYANSAPLPSPLPPFSIKAARREELRALGPTRAYPVTDSALAMLLIAAHREKRAVSVSLEQSALLFPGTLVPRRLERSAGTFHAYDCHAELHLDLEASAGCWWVHDQHGWSLEILDQSGALAARVR